MAKKKFYSTPDPGRLEGMIRSELISEILNLETKLRDLDPAPLKAKVKSLKKILKQVLDMNHKELDQDNRYLLLERSLQIISELIDELKRGAL